MATEKKYTTTCGLSFNYLLKRTQRRTIGFHITNQGLEVRAPKQLAINYIENALEEKKPWIKKHLKTFWQRQKWWADKEKVWRQNGSFPYLGKQVAISLQKNMQKATPYISWHQETKPILIIPWVTSQDKIYEHCKRWLRAQAKEIFKQRLNFFAKQANLEYKRLTLGWSTKVWGWCKNDGAIMLNWRLIHYPIWLIDYVAAHELAHLTYMHHGPEFWQELAAIFPNYEKAKAVLERYHPGCIPIFPSQE